jgi:aspartyl-tRNA(Asn)/glutamyl-tRNA(Gln) amidotransferase subunit A
MDVHTLTIAKARTLLDSKEITAVQLAQAYLDEIAKREEDIHAYIEVFNDVLDQARAADARIDIGESTPLLGIPIAIKDNILIEGRFATSASKILEGYRATYDATVIARLKEQGVVFLGRTNMDEFALGSSTENSVYGPTKNPHDTTRVPGGTSGGSAAAVGGGLALVALGSDTGGSIRQPAAFCGVVGLKPTYGSVSRSGLMAAASSLDVIGPIGRTVADAQTLLEAIRGTDALDSTSLPDSWKKGTTKSAYRVGVPRALLDKGVDPDVREAFDDSLNVLEQAGHKVVDIDLSILDYALATYYIINPAEVSTNVARYDGVRYGLHVDAGGRIEDYKHTRGTGFGPEVRRRILLGTYVLSSGYYDAYYGKAMLAREKLRADVQKTFGEVDAIATPTTPSPAFKLGEKTNDPLSMYLADIFTVSANIIGVPAISVPGGTVMRDGKELPLGFQLMAPELHEATLFDLGTVLEKR